jgi:[NiFe] hydrogenase maturation protein HypF
VSSTDQITRATITVSGTVQGVGFRPFVYRLAQHLKLAGSVINNGGQVKIELFGQEQEIETFVERLRTDAPPLSTIDRVETELQPCRADFKVPEFFLISTSQSGTASLMEVPPDAATCNDCLLELFDSHDRRFLYPFINCTNCGPRFTIIGSLPYDRSSTTMACFPMCRLCRSEYEDPMNRRFHAQPNACWNCGPGLTYTGSEGIGYGASSIAKESTEESLEQALKSIRDGAILAMKGLGGFHLCCDAANNATITRLRELKHREGKPFAVMFPNLDSIAKHCLVGKLERKLLASTKRPIVLLKRKKTSSLPSELSPDTDLVGAMLPYTPLHHIILRELGAPLVMTSANHSDEPIATGNREARQRLGNIADGFLMHNRDIGTRYDDSVVRVILDKEVCLRRSRGYAPTPIVLPFHVNKTILAVGGHLKNTFCLVQGNRAYVSQHIGDLDRIETIDHFMSSLDSFINLFQLTPQIIACDMHPDYGSTRLVEKWLTMKMETSFDMKKIEEVVPVQHHFAHAVSCMIDNSLEEPVIAVTFDGMGYGPDETMWGGEFLLTTFEGFKRVAHINQVGMPGGESAVREPWRMALSWLTHTGALKPHAMAATYANGVDAKQIDIAQRQLKQSINCPTTSSCGRLFDAVAAMLGLCSRSQYEGQAAIILENSASTIHKEGNSLQAYPFEIQTDAQLSILDFAETVHHIVADIEKGTGTGQIALRFHVTLAEAIDNVCHQVRQQTGIDAVCLTGGVFQNALLTKLVSEILVNSEFRVYQHQAVPPNDGGISLGQAVAAAAKLGLIER